MLGAGRGADGTSMAKLPGISIDNALYNEIFANTVIGNFGGGVKMVRTAFYNVVRKNAIIDNNLGKSAKYHFFGVELGGAPADAPVIDLDFVDRRAYRAGQRDSRHALLRGVRRIRFSTERRAGRTTSPAHVGHALKPRRGVAAT